MTLRAAEKAVAALETRVVLLREKRRPIPHRLAERLRAARTAALAAGKRA